MKRNNGSRKFKGILHKYGIEPVRMTVEGERVWTLEGKAFKKLEGKTFKSLQEVYSLPEVKKVIKRSADEAK